MLLRLRLSFGLLPDNTRRWRDVAAAFELAGAARRASVRSLVAACADVPRTASR